MNIPSFHCHSTTEHLFQVPLCSKQTLKTKIANVAFNFLTLAIPLIFYRIISQYNKTEGEGMMSYHRMVDNDDDAKTTRLTACKLGQVTSDVSQELFQNPNSDLKSITIDSFPQCKETSYSIDLGLGSSVFYHRKKNGTHTYVYICKAPPIKNLVISGGGAKGVILPGVIRAFEQHVIDGITFRNQLDNLAGSSIGAVTGILVAAGMTSAAMIHVTDKVNFKGLLGERLGPIQKDGKPLLNFIRMELKSTLSENLNHILQGGSLDDLKNRIIAIKGKKKTRAIIKRVKAVMKEFAKPFDRMSITFAMLEGLHQLNPHIFKSLTVTATHRETGTTFYFDAKRTPNLDIAIAGRASASLPVLLAPVKIKSKYLMPGYPMRSKKYMTFVDGGYFDNIPIGILENRQKNKYGKGEVGQNLQTLALVFDETGRANESHNSPFLDVKVKKHTLYNSSNCLDRLFRDHAAKLFGMINSKRRNTVNKENGLEKIRLYYTQRNIPLAVDIKTGDFHKAQVQIKRYEELGFAQGMAYLNIHQDELIYRTFQSLNELLDYIPANEKRIFVLKGFLQATRVAQ